MKPSEVAYNKIQSIYSNASSVLVIHCSRQNLTDNDGGLSTPRIITIKVKSLDGRINSTFAIHLEAEKLKIIWEEIENYYDQLEGRVLGEFNKFVSDYREYTWIHWDMDGIHFGFEAIRHRYCVLVDSEGKDYCEVPIEKRVNINALLKDIYSDNYENEPMMENLMKSNNNGSHKHGFMTIEEEALAFKRRDFPKILESVQCKVSFLADVIGKTVSRRLNVSNKNFLYRLGLFFAHPIMVAIAWIIGVVGFIISLFCMG